MAKRLDVSIDYVRYALHTLIERPPQQSGRNAAPLAIATQQRARTLLTPEFFQQEYVTGGKRLRRLHAETGFHRKILADYATTAGIQLAPARQPHHIPDAWLREQYLTARRSFPAIAAELGVCEMTVTRAARDLGIPARPPGIVSHPDVRCVLNMQTCPGLVARLRPTSDTGGIAAIDGGE